MKRSTPCSWARGAAVGIVAFLVYGGVFVAATFRHSQTLAWERRHPVLDASLAGPLAFLALAFIPGLSLAVCIAAALAAGAAVVAGELWRRGRRRHSGVT